MNRKIIYFTFLIFFILILFIKIKEVDSIEDRVVGSDHLYHFRVQIKNIDEDYRILSSEVIDESNFLGSGEQCDIDISKAEDYKSHKTFNEGDVIQVYFFKEELIKSDEGNVLTIGSIRNYMDKIIMEDKKTENTPS